MSIYTAIIIDDNQWDAKDLELTLVDVGVFEKIKVFLNVAEAKKWLQKQILPVDFIFCDIEMDGINGLEARSLLKSYAHFFVFCTGHEKYSLQAHRLHVDGYLMKPSSEDEVLTLLDVFRERQRKSLHKQLDYLMLDPVFKSTDVAARKLFKVKLNDISYFQKEGNYVYVYGQLTDASKDLFEKLGVFDGDIKTFMKKYWYLDNLIQITGSKIVNMDWADTVESDMLVIKGVKFTATRTFRENLKRFLDTHAPNPPK